MTDVQQPAERRFADELEALADRDRGPRPEGWRLSPRAVRTFVLGDEAAGISRKYYGDDALVDRCLVTLMGNRGLLLVGEPGTAKSMLSELFAAAVSGNSTLTTQGTAGSTEDQVLYSWNYAMLIANGPNEDALVPGPVLAGMASGSLVRLEEITRMQAEVQDSLISVLSDKYLTIPQLGDAGFVGARRGFNLIATANLRDRGVHEMSSALHSAPADAQADLVAALVSLHQLLAAETWDDLDPELFWEMVAEQRQRVDPGRLRGAIAGLEWGAGGSTMSR